MKNLIFAAMFLLCASANAADFFELGYGGGTTHGVAPENFHDAASSGHGQNLWLGYGLTPNWALEVGYDTLDFDNLNSHHKAILLGGTYRFRPEADLHPLFKLGVASVESKSVTDVKTSSLGARAAIGLEYAWKYVSAGGLMNYYYVQNADDAAGLKGAQAVLPAVFVSIHSAFDFSNDDEESSAPVAPVAVQGDADGDGVIDADDKCPSTSVGLVVNQIGCSEKEKAVVRLNVTFATGKTALAAGSDSEIENLAQFMKKFSDARVEIAGHTDSQGGAAANKALSQKRAEAVQAALVAKGVEASRIHAHGYGSEQPVADNKTAEGRAQNRRVTAEISVEYDKKK